MAYSPAGMGSAQLPQSTVIYYDKKFRDNLKSQTPFIACSERLNLEKNRGNQYQMFMNVPQLGSVTQTTEGTVGTSITGTVLNSVSTIGEYADFINFSSYSLATAIDPTVENMSKELAYRLGVSLNSLVRATCDAASGIDSSVLQTMAATSLTAFSTLNLNAIRNAVQSLAGRSVRPFDDGSKMFGGVIHSFALGDVMSDASNNSPLEILKHTAVGLAKMEELVSVDLTEMITLPATGVSFFQSNLVTSTLNYKGVTGLTALRTYIMGRDGVYSINLGANGDTSYGDGSFQNIRPNVEQNLGASTADPSGLIGGFTS